MTTPRLALIVMVTVTSLTPATSVAEERQRSNGCVGKHVSAGADLNRVSASAPAGTTFCLSRGTFRLRETVTWQAGDSIVGAGMDRTRIRPDGAGKPTVGFRVQGDARTTLFAKLDIGGFRAEATSTRCSPCGTAILNPGDHRSGTTVLLHVRCHSNGTACIGGGGGNLRVRELDCYGNGYHRETLMDPSRRKAACIKMTGGSLTMRDSRVHDNYWNGIWCDHCEHTSWLIEDNVFRRNGHAGIHWEVSGQLATDSAVVRRNVITDNGWQVDAPKSVSSAGIIVADGRHIVVRRNRFGGNRYQASEGSSSLRCCRAVRITDDDRASWSPTIQGVVVRGNRLNGDALQGCEFAGAICSDNRRS